MLMDEVWFEQACFLIAKNSFSVKMKMVTFSEDFASIELSPEGEWQV